MKKKPARPGKGTNNAQGSNQGGGGGGNDPPKVYPKELLQEDVSASFIQPNKHGGSCLANFRPLIEFRF